MNQQQPTHFGRPVGDQATSGLTYPWVDPGRTFGSSITGALVEMGVEYYKAYKPELPYAQRPWATTADGTPKKSDVLYLFVYESAGIETPVRQGDSWENRTIQTGEIVRLRVTAKRRLDLYSSIREFEQSAGQIGTGTTVTVTYDHAVVQGPNGTELKLLDKQQIDTHQSSVSPRKGFSFSWDVARPIPQEDQEAVLGAAELIAADYQRRTEAGDEAVVGPQPPQQHPHGYAAPPPPQQAWAPPPQQAHQPPPVAPPPPAAFGGNQFPNGEFDEDPF